MKTLIVKKMPPVICALLNKLSDISDNWMRYYKKSMLIYTN